MSRRHTAEKRKILAEVNYNSELLTKFMNNIMQDGKKSLSERIVYNAFEVIKSKNKQDPFETFTACMDNVRPNMEVTSVRVGGANYQVPTPVNKDRGNTLAIRWIIKAAKSRSENSMVMRLANELFEASQGRGASVKKKDEVHKMAESNKAFSHFSPKRGG
jgi:small subunit ribosomal protein S7